MAVKIKAIIVKEDGGKVTAVTIAETIEEANRVLQEMAGAVFGTIDQVDITPNYKEEE